jgi:hypothetical protein
MDSKNAALQNQKIEFEIQEIKLKIQNLKMPAHRRATFWISLLAAAAAVLGVLGQKYLSDAKSERVQLQLEKAQDSLLLALEHQNIAQQNYDQIQTRIEDASRRLSQFAKELDQYYTSPMQLNKNQLDSIKSLIIKLSSTLFYFSTYIDASKKGSPKSTRVIEFYTSLPAHVFFIPSDRLGSLNEKAILGAIVNKQYTSDAEMQAFSHYLGSVSVGIKFCAVAISKHGDIVIKTLE